MEASFVHGRSRTGGMMNRRISNKEPQNDEADPGLRDGSRSSHRCTLGLLRGVPSGLIAMNGRQGGTLRAEAMGVAR